MSALHRNRTEPAVTEPAVTEPAVTEPPDAPAAVSSRPPARTRTSAAWLGACLAAAVFAVLIIFMLQNTGSVEVTFLWLHGDLPLAIALFIAAVGASLLTMAVGAARITQLRRRLRQHS